MHPEQEVARLGGVARTSMLWERGHSKYFVSRAVAAGSLTRPSRGWVALPHADPELIAAARDGYVLSCITQARRLGLWVLEESEPHVGARTCAGNPGTSACRVHWGEPLVPRAPDQLVDPIENVLGYVAGCQPFEAALAVWESALNKRLVDVELLKQLPLKPSARQLLYEAHPYSDSGLESLLRARLKWLKLSVAAQAWVHGRRVDFLIDGWLVVQVDGSHHVDAQRESDVTHDAELIARGISVIRLGYRQLVHDWQRVQQLIMNALARGPAVRARERSAS